MRRTKEGPKVIVDPIAIRAAMLYVFGFVVLVPFSIVVSVPSFMYFGYSSESIISILIFDMIMVMTCVILLAASGAVMIWLKRTSKFYQVNLFEQSFFLRIGLCQVMFGAILLFMPLLIVFLYPEVSCIAGLVLMVWGMFNIAFLGSKARKQATYSSVGKESSANDGLYEKKGSYFRSGVNPIESHRFRGQRFSPISRV